MRMPISSASRKGVSGVVAAAEDQTVVLTNHGRAVALVEGANQVEASARLLREASLAVLDAAADLVEQRTPRFSLDEVCARLGVSADHVRALVAVRMSAAP
ncbi:MAG: hypothetical protein F2842_12190 [Actinobacteria bacterium]|nr:hypothetical protein [Actinomycetota bacterium]